ncbi:siderophore-interacting protein [Agrobacterium sp. AGB01]|uniref:siderophore-interacting protein n=1 Tax=Agrobacterium sp. AGB01 TaxID=2769302 RepID=UPI001AEE5C86|nr:siderophore-interacting protein [Agrobacterium sp. AGB01]
MTTDVFTSSPKIERIRHELKRRDLTVIAKDNVTPAMLRITLKGDDASDFVSLGADDHIKIFIPTLSGDTERRDYTPRRYDTSSRTVVIDFAIHEAGPATQWALNAKIGDVLSIGGPKGSAVVSPDIINWLLVGDETALPAIGRRIEEALPGQRISAVIAITGPDEKQDFTSKAKLDIHWVYRPLSDAAKAALLLQALEQVEIARQTFVWVAAEASVTRDVRRYLVEQRGHALTWTKASGYWVKGMADAHEKFE